MEMFFNFIGGVVEVAIVGIVWICIMLIIGGMRKDNKKNTRY